MRSIIQKQLVILDKKEFIDKVIPDFKLGGCEGYKGCESCDDENEKLI